MCLTETHLSPNITDSEININSYSNDIHRRDRLTGPGGGVIIYYKNTVHTIRRQDLEHEDVEMIWIEVLVDKKKILLGCIYRPESNVEYWNKLDHVLENACNTAMDIIITGDINVNMLDIPGNHHLSRLLIKYNLTSLIDEPTRITETTATAIDILFSNNVNIIKNSTVKTPICSDHSIVHLTCSNSVFKHKAYKKKILIYNDADFDQMNRTIKGIDWDALANNLNSNEFNNHLTEVINKQIDECILVKL